MRNKYYPNWVVFNTFILILFLIAEQKAFIMTTLTILFFMSVILNPLFIITPTIIFSIFYYFSIGNISFYRISVIFTILSLLLNVASQNKKLKISKETLFWFIILISTTLISLFNTLSLRSSLDALKTLSLEFLLYIFLSGYRFQNTNDIHSFEKIFSYIIIFSSFAIGLLLAKYNRLTSTMRLTLMQFNPNSIAISLAQLSVGLFWLYLYTRSKFLKILAIFLLLQNSILLFLTGSRSSVFGTLVGIIILMSVYVAKYRKYKFIFYFKALVLTAGVLSLIYFIIKNYEFSIILRRFTIQDILLSKRLYVWSHLIREVIPQNLLFGVGIGGKNVVYALANVGIPYLYQYPAHNVILDLIAQIGIVGSIPFIIFFYRSSYYGYMLLKNVDFDIVKIFPILFFSVLAIGVGESIFYNKFLWITVSLIWNFYYTLHRKF